MAVEAESAQNDALCLETYAQIALPQYWQLNKSHQIICRTEYALSYNPNTKIADWVIERVDPEQLDGNAERQNNFIPDPLIQFQDGPTLADYRRSGYDRGHLAAAGNMKASQEAMDESFYLTNMAPQVGVGFNRLVWRQLEEAVRDWVKSSGTLYVLSGPVYGDYQPTIGNNQIVVPDAFYKIIYNPRSEETIAFLMPNTALESMSFNRYITSVRDIESATGLNFFAAFPFEQQNRLETPVAQLWP